MKRKILGLVLAGLVTAYSGVKESSAQTDITPLVSKALDDFEKKPVKTQNEIVDGLEFFVRKETYLGRVLDDVDKAIKVENVPNYRKDAILEYNQYTNQVLVPNVSARNKMIAFILGSPLSYVEGHEKIHALQDASSEWDDFEGLMYGTVIDPQTLQVREKFNISMEQLYNFAKWYMPLGRVRIEEVKSRFLEMVERYENEFEDRYVLRETQAYLLFDPAKNEMYIYESIKKRASYVSFEKVQKGIKLNLEVIGILDPVTAAKFVGSYGSTFESFEKAVNDLRGSTSPRDAYASGIEKRKKAHGDGDKMRRKVLKELGIKLPSSKK